MKDLKNTDVCSILERVMLLCRDDGVRFTTTDRLDEIEKVLFGSAYQRVDREDLFRLYAKRPIEELKGPLLLVSSHVDCEANITKCFCEDIGGGLLKGTFDNAATNAAILSVMLDGDLPDNVVVSFTGDEERGSKGAEETVEYLRSKQLKIDLAVILDVTDMGWEEGADFTVENNFWRDDQGKRIIEKAKKLGERWRFVPEDTEDIPSYVPPEMVIHEEAEADESWDLDEMDVPCFSFCLPVNGNMHSNAGVLARKDSLAKYCSALKAILSE
ncbi:hypothetical protein IKZ40_00660 [bacterium]|nr:hypothetical protein [bacterium]